MYRGGYKIIDITGHSFTEQEGSVIATVPGIYEALESNYRNAILFAGFSYGSVEYNDSYVDVTVSGDDFVFSTYGFNFAVNDDDEITLTVASSTATATTTKAGTVKKATNVAAVDPGSGSLTADLATTVNSILTALKSAGIMANS